MKKFFLLAICFLCYLCLQQTFSDNSKDQHSFLEISSESKIQSTPGNDFRRTPMLVLHQKLNENRRSDFSTKISDEYDSPETSNVSKYLGISFLVILSLLACVYAVMRVCLVHSFSLPVFLAMMKKSFLIKKHSAASSFITEIFVPIGTASLMLIGLSGQSAQIGFGQQVSTFIIIIFTLPISQMVRSITEERNSGIKEAFQIMGMKRWLATGTWAIYYTILLSFLALIFSIATSIGLDVEFGPVLLFNLLCGFATVAFSLFVTAFFTKPLAAGIVTPIALVGFSIFFTISSLAEEGMFKEELFWVKYLCCLNPISVYMWGSFSYTGTGYGLYLQGFILCEAPCLVLALLTVVYSILAWYIERVMPSSKGSYYPPCFLFTKEYWGKEDLGKRTLDFDGVEIGEDIEPPLEGSKPIIKIRNLVKTFTKNREKFNAVDHLNVTMYDDQVFCLLGHNGAGKTTTMSILTGQLRADGGDVLIDGYSIVSQQDAARKSMGICPQNNIIYKTLSVREHVELVAVIKGVAKDNIKQEVSNIISLVGLDDQINTKADALSGGMKRKLCLAMALVGDPKVVLLDEPTAGMDPQSRHKIWELVQKVKQNKIIILTTHYMDEADLLGDRIAILSSGQLKCVGTSLFLKQRFGVGYILTLEKNTSLNLDGNQLVTKLQEFAPNITKTEEAVNNITIRIPLTETPKLPKLFEYIDSITAEDEFDKSKALQGYGISMTTLEQVFVNLAHAEEEKKKQINDEINNQSKDIALSITEKDKEDESNIYIEQTADWNVRYNDKKPFQEFRAFLYKRFVCFKRSRVTIFVSVICTLIYLITMISICGTGKDAGDTFSVLLPYTVLAFYFVTTNSIEFIITERVCKSKRLQQMCGANIGIFWLGNIVFDTLIYGSAVVLLFMFGVILYNSFFYIAPAFPLTLLVLLLLFWYSALGLSYLISLYIDTPSRGQSLNLSIHFLFGFAPFFVSIFTEILNPENEFHWIMNLLRLIPGFSLVEGAFNIGVLFNDRTSENSLWSWDCAGGDIVMTIISGTIIACILLQKETRFFTVKINKLYLALKTKSGGMNEETKHLLNLESPQLSTLEVNTNTDADVAKEQHLVESLVKEENFGSQYPVVLHQLTKMFPKTRKTPEVLAVDHLSLGVPNGECFGLLGINGAGKTTTLSMLTQDLSASSGDAFMSGKSINGDLFSSNTSIGYCPQFDPLIPVMTVRDHLNLFGTLRGIPPTRLDDVINSILGCVGLSNNADVYSKNLSGGMKRKLSLCIALIGGPDVIFLDEPTTGLDPLACHHAWEMIKTAASGKCVIFTTHSMEECETLCTRVGIMMRGQFYCLGSVQHLKNKFGGSYFLEAKAKHGKVDDVKAFVSEEFPSAKLEQQQNELLKFSIPRDSIRIGAVFEKIETNKENSGIASYSVTQTTLEEVFISIANANVD